jgi:hypothetical protein
MNLCPENAADLISQTLGWIRANAARGKQRSGFSYARIVRAAFEDIRELTAEGVSYAAICEAFEANGLLPKGSEPYSLSRAMRREGARRQKRAEPARTERLAGKPAGKPDSGTPRALSAGKERVKELTASTEETALGKITRHSDGSFDFD